VSWPKATIPVSQLASARDLNLMSLGNPGLSQYRGGRQGDLCAGLS